MHMHGVVSTVNLSRYSKLEATDCSDGLQHQENMCSMFRMSERSEESSLVTQPLVDFTELAFRRGALLTNSADFNVRDTVTTCSALQCAWTCTSSCLNPA